MNSDGIGTGMSTSGQLPPPDYEQSRKSSSGDGSGAKCVVPAVQYAGNVTTVTGPSWGPVQPAQSYSYPQQFPGYSNVAYYPPPVYGGNRDSVSGAGQVIVIQQAAPVPVGKSYTCHTAAACLLFWFCGCVFGGIAFLLAILAKNESAAGREKEARKYGLASMWVSIVGLVIGLVAWGFTIWAIVVLVTTANNHSNTCNYWCNGFCYTNRYYWSNDSPADCSTYYSGCYSSGYCYYNY